VDDARVGHLLGEQTQHTENQVEDEVTVGAERERETVFRVRRAQQVQLQRFVGGEGFDQTCVRRADADERQETRGP